MTAMLGRGLVTRSRRACVLHLEAWSSEQPKSGASVRWLSIHAKSYVPKKRTGTAPRRGGSSCFGMNGSPIASTCNRNPC